MRYRFAFLLVLMVLPVENTLSAPVPAPSAILAIGPSPDPKVNDETYRKEQKESQSCHGILVTVYNDPEVHKLPLIARMKDPLPWLANNLRVVAEDGGSRLRLSFRAGTRAEQVTILNAFLRANFYFKDRTLKWSEKCVRRDKELILELEQRIKSTMNAQEAASLQEAIRDLRTRKIPELQAALTRAKQTKVIRWAK